MRCRDCAKYSKYIYVRSSDRNFSTKWFLRMIWADFYGWNSAQRPIDIDMGEGIKPLWGKLWATPHFPNEWEIIDCNERNTNMIHKLGAKGEHTGIYCIFQKTSFKSSLNIFKSNGADYYTLYFAFISLSFSAIIVFSALCLRDASLVRLLCKTIGIFTV